MMYVVVPVQSSHTNLYATTSTLTCTNNAASEIWVGALECTPVYDQFIFCISGENLSVPKAVAPILKILRRSTLHINFGVEVLIPIYRGSMCRSIKPCSSWLSKPEQ